MLQVVFILTLDLLLFAAKAVIVSIAAGCVGYTLIKAWKN